jgi:hypothetical protein
VPGAGVLLAVPDLVATGVVDAARKAKILADGFDILTYRKGKWRNLPRSSFAEKRATIDGHKVSYDLADQGSASAA